MHTPYIHDERTHNTLAAEQIVPELLRLFKPVSVLDVGCGIGTFLHIWRSLGVNDVVGVDGPWTNRELLLRYVPRTNFVEADLSKPLDLGRRFDLVESLEVAEHLPEGAAERFVESLVRAGDTVVFAAARPGQGGQNHVNEQPLAYWISKFRSRGYRFVDCLRPVFWRNAHVDPWYRQNMVVFLRDGVHAELKATDDRMAEVVHPESWQAVHGAKYQDLINGSEPLSRYVKLLLLRLFGPVVAGHVNNVVTMLGGRRNAEASLRCVNPSDRVR